MLRGRTPIGCYVSVESYVPILLIFHMIGSIPWLISFLFSMNPSSSSSFSSPQQQAQWCPEKQIYVNGLVPALTDDFDLLLKKLQDENGGRLLLFGYGSLCWNPGNPHQDTLAMTHLGVTSKVASAIGYKRCWSQKSTDHRGTPTFPGIVCTLLTDEEFHLLQGHRLENVISLTTGLLFSIPADLVSRVLKELDFREKGGYARDIIKVQDHESGQIVQALLYRGTPDNPAFWKRALSDLSFTAAVISKAVGPSGPNDYYLNSLDQFLAHHPKRREEQSLSACLDHDTPILAKLTQFIQQNTHVFFLNGAGSNQYNQLSIHNEQGKEIKQMTEAILFVPKLDAQTSEEGSMDPHTCAKDRPRQVYAGGTHSALLTKHGDFYLWGGNHHGQLGRNNHSTDSVTHPLISIIPPLHGIRVDQAALGHFHTLIIEEKTNMLYAFGDDSRGQVSGRNHSTTRNSEKLYVSKPTVPFGIRSTDTFAHVAAGVFHSAAVTTDGYLITFGAQGCGLLETNTDPSSSNRGRWKPEDGSNIVQVACGHRHTVALDEHGRLWTMGQNNFSQLGHKKNESLEGKGTRWAKPQLVDGELGEKGSGCRDIYCGWSHTVVLVTSSSTSSSVTRVFGWGRNDKGQLGLGEESDPIIRVPTSLFQTSPIKNKLSKVCCGSESTHVIDIEGNVWGCGWNEHGNLGIDSCDENVYRLSLSSGSKPFDSSSDILLSAGGAHVLIIGGDK